MKLKRLQALFLSVIIIFSMTANLVPTYAVFSNSDSEFSRCPHHLEHTGCSYQEEFEGSECDHVHNVECGYRQTQEEVPCDSNCTDVDHNGTIDHTEKCSYQAAIEGQDCTHSHDDSCGYKAPIDPVPCDFVCPICDCVCTCRCDETIINENCPSCRNNYESCTFTTADISLTFSDDYAEYGNDSHVDLAIDGRIVGKKVSNVQVSVLLTDEEIAMLDMLDTTNVLIKENKLMFSLSKEDDEEEIAFNDSIAVRADVLSTLDISDEDIDVIIAPQEYQNSPYVSINAVGDKITFVENLPTDEEYGSGTAYTTQVEDCTVHYVDSKGQSAPRQEMAPVFTLYYLVEGGYPTSLEEENLPFEMNEVPNIVAQAQEDKWIGRVEDASSLPSKVLALEEGNYIEKEVNWFLMPSYPDDYFENAGMLVEITEKNAQNYPDGLGIGWYFIGGLEPFPDDVVTVEKYVDNLSHHVYWADNGNVEGKRPQALDGLYELQYSLDGSSNYQTLTEENMEKLGMYHIPLPTENVQDGIWLLEWRNSLPEKVCYSDITGSGNILMRDISWRIVFKQAPESYAMVEVTPENAPNYSSVKDNYGTYYVLETTLTFNARIYQGTEGYDIKQIGEAFLEQFYLDAAYTGNQHQYFQLSAIRDDGHYKPVDNPDGSNLISITITNLWRYNLDNTRINYSIREGKTADDVDYRLTEVEGLEEGDYFSVSYDNSMVPSFGSEVNAVYSGGILKLTLTGTIEYHATKQWLDDGKIQRPTAILELWRYRSGQPYTTASLVRNESGKHITLNLDTVEPNSDGTYSIDFIDNLPKYDPEGYRYRYVTREYLSGINAERYEQVFGTVAQDGTVTDTLPDDSPRDANNTFLYNGGVLSNRLKGTIQTSVTKKWQAASFQSEFDDVMVELRLQFRMKGQNEEWENTEYTYQMFGFLSENLTITHQGNYPQYNALGQELEYRWVEEAIWQGGKMEDGVYTGGHKILPSFQEDGSRSFVLSQNNREIVYTSECILSDDEKENCTMIVNSIANVIDYDVTKEFSIPWNEGEFADSYTFSLFRTTSGSGIERYATFTIDKDTTNISPDITKHIEDHASLSIEQIDGWHVVIHGLPEFDEYGQQYEYLLLEEDGSPTSITTKRDDDGNYTSIVYNGPGSGNIILVRKEWVDESDSQHRLPVEITVYDRTTNEPIGEPVTLGTDSWYALVGIGERDYHDVYILETKVGDTEIDNPTNENGKLVSPIYEGEKNCTTVQFSTQYHNYEATYSYEKILGDSEEGDDAYEGIHCYTVTNRRLGNINLTVTKKWIDGSGEQRTKLQKALEESGLHLAIKLEFMDDPSLEMEQVYDISCSGYGKDDQGDTVTISQGNPTAIQDQQGKWVDSIQLVDLTQLEQTLYFWHLPKYDASGASVRYTVEEIFVDENGNEISDLSDPKYSDVSTAWQEYAKSMTIGPYVVGENHALDTQEFTITNKLSNTTDVNWYTLWLDEFAYKEGSRPDIYLNIYARVHNEDGSIQTKLVIRNYRWEFEESDDDPQITQQNYWKCTIENLPKYDDMGYQIDYFALMDSVVSTSDFDYLPTSYAPGKAIDNASIFATASSLEEDTTHENLVVNVSEDPNTIKYALMSGNIFINTIYNTISFSGEKLWTNLPNEYPLIDLPSVTFTLNRSTADGTQESNIATMSIAGSDWQNLNVNGHYTFTFGHTGENHPSSYFDEETVPLGETLLPRFDDKGRLYTYTLEETVNWRETDVDISDATDTIFDVSSSGQTFSNSYKLTGTAQLSAKKYLNVVKGKSVYPAVKIVLTRTYKTNSGSVSKPEIVKSMVWSAEEVKMQAELSPSSDGLVTLEKTFTFDGLPTYAPNGSKYIYTVSEDKSQLGGFKTWAAEGDIDANHIQLDENLSDFVTNLVANEDAAIDATFLNEPEADPEVIQIIGGKEWVDLNDNLRPENIAQGLSVTLERSANMQTGQGNSIDWHKVDITGKIKWEQDPENADRWIYTITGMERYAYNGMPWVYRIVEEPVAYYTASNNGIATQKSQDNISGNITMYDLRNSLLTSISFKKIWVDSNGKTITENLLGDDIELEVKYELQVRAQEKRVDGDGAWSDWQTAAGYFKEYHELDNRTYSGVIRATLESPKWNTNNSFNDLPCYVMDDADSVYALEYRVVETEVNVYRVGQDKPLLTQTYTAPLNNGSNPYAYTVSGGTNALLNPYCEGGKASQANGTTTHKNQIKTTEITIAKEWKNDHNEVYKTRPDTDATRYDWEVTLIVQQSTDNGQTWNSEPVETVTLYGTNAEDKKSAIVDGLPQFAFDSDGKLQSCSYRVIEMQSEEATGQGEQRQWLNEGETFNGSYAVSYSDDGLTVTNTLATTEFEAVKKWNDVQQTHPSIVVELRYLKKGGNPDNPADYKSFAPDAQVQLGYGQSITNRGDALYYAKEDWIAVWKAVPLRMVGSELDDVSGNTIYKIFEIVEGGYITQAETIDNTTTITNTPAVTPSVTKHWLGVSAAQEVTVALYRKIGEDASEEIVETAILKESKNWSHTFTQQPLYDANGNAYEYWVEETQIDGQNAIDVVKTNGYAVSYGGDSENGFHIYNHKLDTIYVVKDWADVSDSEHRPNDLQLTLQRTTVDDPIENDWQTVEDVHYLWRKDGDRWEASFSSLPQYDVQTGKAYRYQVIETVPEGYEQEIVHQDGNMFHFKNIRSELMDIPVQKVWVDNNDKLGYRPDEIALELYANDLPTGKIVTLKPETSQISQSDLTDCDSWSGVFENLPKYDNTGKLIDYTVVEISRPEHYVVSYNKLDDGTQRITNTATGNLIITKNVIGGNKPMSKFHFSVQLNDNTINGTYGEMTFEDGVAEFTLGDGENITATDLPAGVLYTVTEEEANQGAYITQSTGEVGAILPGDTVQAIFTNQMSVVSISVVKKWDDNNDEHGKRPTEIVVVLLANGEEVGERLVLNEENNWEGSFVGLNEYNSGQKIVYTVEEAAVEGYETSINGNAQTGFIITNRYMPDSQNLVTDDPPQTGDKENLSLWILLCCLGVLGITTILGTMEYKKNKQLKGK